ncbi:MAG: response regulator [Planctomycetota bacterium]
MSSPDCRPEIAVVDDDPITMRVIERVLNQEFHVRSFSDASSLLEAVRASPPEIIISDVQMPGVSGFDLVQSIRCDRSLPYIPILLISGTTTSETVARGLDGGADDYLSKPIEPSRLLARIRAALRIRRAMHELDAKNRELGEALEKLHDTQVQMVHMQRLEAIGQLAAGIAHEINTPTQFVSDNLYFLSDAIADSKEAVSKLRALTELLAASPEHAAAEEILALLEKSICSNDVCLALDDARHGLERITSIVGAMKEFSHPGTGEKVETDINAAIQTTLSVARNEWKYVAEVTLHLLPDLALPRVLPDELNQVFLNLIVNGAHAIDEQNLRIGREKGELHIRTFHQGSAVYVEFEDNGPGIPEEIQKRIFDPFFTTKQVGKGTGQGLAIARSVVVDKHSGTLEYFQASSGGALFRVGLPLSEEAE